MPLEPVKVQFLQKLLRSAKIKEAFDQVQTQKQKILQEVVVISDEEKELLRAYMTFKVEEANSKKKIRSMDKEGQIKSIESEEAMLTKGWSQETHKKAQEAMDKIVAKLNQLRDAKMEIPGLDGNMISVPIFPLGPDGENDDIRREFFDPLVREGLMPETFVPDEFSSTKRLLDHAFEEYEQALKDQKDEAKRKLAKEEIDVHGGGKDGATTAKAKGARMKRSMEDKFANAMGKGETRAERLQYAKTKMKVYSAGLKTVKAFSAVNAILPPEVHEGISAILGGIQSGAETELAQLGSLFEPDESNQIAHDLSEAGIDETPSDPTTTDGTTVQGLTQDKPTVKKPTPYSQVAKDFQKLGNDFNEITTDPSGDDFQELGQDLGQTGSDMLGTSAGVIATGSGKVGRKVIRSGQKIAKNIKKLKNNHKDVLKKYNRAAWTTLINQAAVEICNTHAKALADAVKKVDEDAASLVAQAHRAVADPGAVADFCLEDPEPNCQGAIDLLAKAFADALVEAAPPGGEEVFKKIGAAVANEFKAAAKADTLKLYLLTAKKPKGETEEWERPSTEEVFRQLVAPAAKAVAKVIGISLDDQPPELGADPEAANFRNLLSDPNARSAIEAKMLVKQEQEALKDLAESQKENDEYERELTLVDEAGEIANQGKIIKLIEQLQKERLILETAAAFAKLVKGGGGGGVGIAGKAGATVAEQVIPALKLAGLTAQFVVNIIKAAERWALWAKFKGAYDMAKKASSALAPAIDRFFTNKQEQCAQHTIEDAMIVAQIIGETLALDYGTGIGLAVGKAVSAVGKAGQAINKAAFAMYDIAQLKKAWTVTKLAVQSPKNRRLGLEALSLNTSLAMHAIVWAAVEDRDPIGRQMMQACGLNEKTLDDKATDSGAVKLYLKTLLKEDRWVEDEDKTLRPDWQPATVELNRRSWLIARQRAETKAEPKLQPGTGSAIEKALQAVEAHDPDTTSSGEIRKQMKEMETLLGELKGYTPVAVTRQVHAEMRGLADRYVELANERLLALTEQFASQRSNITMGSRGNQPK